jgi:protein SCO1/2
MRISEVSQMIQARSQRSPRLLAPTSLLLVLLAAAGAPAIANDSADEHAAHHAAAASAVEVRHAAYEIPDATLQNERGEPVDLVQLLSTDQPVAINFIFTSCTTICPVMTATMLQVQRELAGAQPAPRFVSISIDPDFDSAAVLREYAARYHADWTFLTGKREVILRVLQAFDAWRGNKTNHIAITLLRQSPGTHWTRVEGLTSAQELVELWRGKRD